MYTGKIGIGVITCNRLEYFKQCITSIPKDNTVIVINDGRPYPKESYPPGITKLVQHSFRRGVGFSKNEAFKYLLRKECEHIFLIEDDVQIVDQSVFQKYITASTISGIRHFNYGYHGPRNKSLQGLPQFRLKYSYNSDIAVIFNRNLVGAFSYYHASVLNRVGMMDFFFYNFMEHVDHTKRIIDAGFHPPFWWFADIENSHLMIDDLDPNLTNSSIANKTFQWNIVWGKLWFYLKHFSLPWSIPDVSEDIVKNWLEITFQYNNRNDS